MKKIYGLLLMLALVGCPNEPRDTTPTTVGVVGSKTVIQWSGAQIEERPTPLNQVEIIDMTPSNSTSHSSDSAHVMAAIVRWMGQHSDQEIISVIPVPWNSTVNSIEDLVIVSRPRSR